MEGDRVSDERRRLAIAVAVEVGVVRAVACARGPASPMAGRAPRGVGAASPAGVEARDRREILASKADVARERDVEELSAELEDLVMGPEARLDLGLRNDR